MNGYIIALIFVLAIVLIALLAKGFQRHDPPRQHHWPEGLDTDEDASRRQSSDSGTGKGGGAS